MISLQNNNKDLGPSEAFEKKNNKKPVAKITCVCVSVCLFYNDEILKSCTRWPILLFDVANILIVDVHSIYKAEITQLRLTWSYWVCFYSSNSLFVSVFLLILRHYCLLMQVLLLKVLFLILFRNPLLKY